MSIRESGGSVGDASTEQSQVTIEGSIIERTQFDSYGGRIACNAVEESEWDTWHYSRTCEVD